MKKFLVYLDDGVDCYRMEVPAEDEEAAKDYVKGNGEVVAVKDVTDEYPISIEEVEAALLTCGFNSTETRFMTRALMMVNMAQ